MFITSEYNQTKQKRETQNWNSYQRKYEPQQHRERYKDMKNREWTEINGPALSRVLSSIKMKKHTHTHSSIDRYNDEGELKRKEERQEEEEAKDGWFMHTRFSWIINSIFIKQTNKMPILCRSSAVQIIRFWSVQLLDSLPYYFCFHSARAPYLSIFISSLSFVLFYLPIDCQSNRTVFLVRPLFFFSFLADYSKNTHLYVSRSKMYIFSRYAMCYHNNIWLPIAFDWIFLSNRPYTHVFFMFFAFSLSKLRVKGIFLFTKLSICMRMLCMCCLYWMSKENCMVKTMQTPEWNMENSTASLYTERKKIVFVQKDWRAIYTMEISRDNIETMTKQFPRNQCLHFILQFASS